MSEQTPAAQLLVVDDNEMNRDLLLRRLERQGYQVSLAEDGEQALHMIRAHHYDLVFLDIMMPKLNGYQVLEQVKADAGMRETPIIVISALSELDSVVKCIELGAEDYLFKPFNPVLLKARVSAVLEKNRLRAQSGAGLKTPVDEIISATQILAATASALAPEQKDALMRIMASAETLATRLEEMAVATNPSPR
jgi:adenylate cyclase